MILHLLSTCLFLGLGIWAIYLTVRMSKRHQQTLKGYKKLIKQVHDCGAQISYKDMQEHYKITRYYE